MWALALGEKLQLRRLSPCFEGPCDRTYSVTWKQGPQKATSARKKCSQLAPPQPCLKVTGPSQGWQTGTVSRSTHLFLLGQAATWSYVAFSRNLREWLGDLEMDPRGLKILSPEHPWCRNWWPVWALTMMVTAHELLGDGGRGRHTS